VQCFSAVSRMSQRIAVKDQVFLLKENNSHTCVGLDKSYKLPLHFHHKSETTWIPKIMVSLTQIVCNTWSVPFFQQCAFEEMSLFFVEGLENGSLSIQYSIRQFEYLYRLHYLFPIPCLPYDACCFSAIPSSTLIREVF
jgi:hypothetical protein